MIFELNNPIPWSVVDSAQLRKFLNKFKMIPYYGTHEDTSHRILKILRTLTKLSPTFQSVRRDLREFTFGHNIQFVGNSFPGLSVDPVDLEPNAQIEYGQYLADLNITLPHWNKVLRSLDDHIAENGNGYLRIRRVVVDDLVQYYFKVEHYLHVIYLDSEDPGEEFAVVSKFLGDENLMRKYPPDVIRVSQAFDSIVWGVPEAGVEETIIHVKAQDSSDPSDWYARAEVESLLPDLYVDHKNPMLQAKVSDEDLISRILLLFEAEDPNLVDDDYEEDNPEVGNGGNIGGRKLDRFERNMLTLKKLTTSLETRGTNGRDKTASSIAGIEYPHGGKKPEHIKLDVNMDTAHHKYQRESGAAMICSRMGHNLTLLGYRQERSGLGGSLFRDLFDIMRKRTIEPRQIFYQDLTNSIFTTICEIEGGSDNFKNYGIKFPDVIGELGLAPVKEEEAANTNKLDIDSQNSNEDGEEDTLD